MKTSEEVKNYFESLRLLDWEILPGNSSGGQAIGIYVRNVTSLQKGFFRVLTSVDKLDKNRFEREVDILTTKEFKNRNIVNILEYSVESKYYWYISELGYPFKTFWKSFRKKNNPNRSFEKAIEIVVKLANGLIRLHEESVVHRDIKPDNIVMTPDREPVLIDFGIAYKPEENRLTPANHATGNARFSPDQVMNWQDDVPPWIDIFHLGQLLIYMVGEKSGKNHWERPVHWMYARHPLTLSEKNANILRAITALTSLRSTSPKNAVDFIKIIDNIFKNSNIYNMDQVSKNIAEAIQMRYVSMEQNHVNNVTLLTSQFDIATTFINKINESLVQAAAALDKSLGVKVMSNLKGEYYQETIFSIDRYVFDNNGPRGNYTYPCLRIDFGNTQSNQFFLKTSLCVQIPEFRNLYQPAISSDFINFYLWFEFDFQLANPAVDGLSKYYCVHFNPSGEIIVVMNNYTGGNTIEGFIEYAIAQFSNSKAWG